MYRLELLLGADDFDVNATVRLQASNNLGALRSLALIGLGDRLLAALAFGVDAVGRNTLGNQVVLDRSGTLLGQLLVVGVAADAVGVTDGQDDFQLHVLGLGGEIVELGLAGGQQDGLVELEQGVGSQLDLLLLLRLQRVERLGRIGKEDGIDQMASQDDRLADFIELGSTRTR